MTWVHGCYKLPLRKTNSTYWKLGWAIKNCIDTTHHNMKVTLWESAAFDCVDHDMLLISYFSSLASADRLLTGFRCFWAVVCSKFSTEDACRLSFCFCLMSLRGRSWARFFSFCTRPNYSMCDCSLWVRSTLVWNEITRRSTSVWSAWRDETSQRLYHADPWLDGQQSSQAERRKDRLSRWEHVSS